MKMTFYCDKCGNELPPKSEFCNKCGNNISDDSRGYSSRGQREGGYNMMGFHMGMPLMMLIGGCFFVLMILMMFIMGTQFNFPFR